MVHAVRLFVKTRFGKMNKIAGVINNIICYCAVKTDRTYGLRTLGDHCISSNLTAFQNQWATFSATDLVLFALRGHVPL